MSAEVLNETDFEIDLQEYAELADFIMAKLHVSTSAEVNVVFIDPDAMEQLHVKWLDLPGPTDVMSFPMDELHPGTEEQPTPEGMLGDICICPEVAAKQAVDAGHSLAEEMLMLCTHGMLHLLGYDHAEEAERNEMFDLQRKLLLTFLAGRK